MFMKAVGPLDRRLLRSGPTQRLIAGVKGHRKQCMQGQRGQRAQQKVWESSQWTTLMRIQAARLRSTQQALCEGGY